MNLTSKESSVCVVLWSETTLEKYLAHMWEMLY